MTTMDKETKEYIQEMRAELKEMSVELKQAYWTIDTLLSLLIRIRKLADVPQNKTKEMSKSEEEAIQDNF